MSAFVFGKSLYDVALKPRLLRSLINEHIPEEKQQLRNSLALEHLVSAIRTHELLSERVVQSPDNQKLIEKWKSSVDFWIDRVLMLVSSNMPDKCWAGICLLGVTIEGCSSERFLASYSVWLQKLLTHLQASAGSKFVKLACCASISDLLTRLSGFPNMKREGSTHAAKLIQPLLNLLQEDISDVEGPVNLLCTVLTSFPSSLQKNYDSAEAAIVTKLISGKCNTNLVKKLAICLSLLPNSRGDADSWSLMIQKLLLAINKLLNDSFEGLKEETKTMLDLIPLGDQPTPLGGLTIFDFFNKSTNPERVSMATVSSLMLCCSTMLTTSHPAQAKVPIQLLLMLVERVLKVDGSLKDTSFLTITAMQQEYVCLELPVLHSYSLDILCGIVKEARSQLLPHAGHIIKIVKYYLRECELPALRIKLYALIKLMLLSMGVGLSLYLAEDVVYYTSIDLGSVVDRGDKGGSNPESIMPKKRKHELTATSIGNQVEKKYVPRNPIPIALKIAALEALETLLTVGGALGSNSWRSNVDSLIITVATNACKGGWIKPANDFINNSDNSSCNLADFQLASLRALLASLLSPGRIRPPYLAHGLELYRKGKQETGTKLAEFCAHAIMALEVLIHPRAIPLIDFGSSIEYTGAQEHISTSRNEPESEEDDLCEKWVKDNDGNQPHVTEQENNVTIQLAEKVEVSSVAEVVPAVKGKGLLVEIQPVEEANKQSEVQSQTVDFRVADNMVTCVPETEGKTVVSGSVGGTAFKFDIVDEDDPMDEIPDIVDVEPDSDED